MRKSRFKLSRLLATIAVGAVVMLVGVFVWGYFQPKPDGFSAMLSGEEAAIRGEWNQFTIDARSKDAWAFFEFESGQSVKSDDEWDLAFKRTDLLLNTAVSEPTISKWYNYSFITHTVSAKDDTYLLLSAGKSDVLLKFDSYYCDNEDPGCVTFLYRYVAKSQG